jgi:F-type H+-transporting ATPase subunit b
MESLGIDFRLFIAQIVNFGIFYVIFSKFIAKPLLKHINKLKHDEQVRLDITNKLREDSQKSDEAREVILKSAKDKQKEIIDQARKYTDEMKAEVLAKAKKQAEDLVQQGNKQVAEERQKAMSELQDYVKEVAKDAVLKTLSEELDEETKNKITKKIISNL